MKNQELELLAPAGSFESFLAAVKAGADAVYIGGGLFGARAYAENPGEESLLRAIDISHIHHKKLYLTVNTLLKNKELEEQLYFYLEPLYRAGLDAVIVQDMGVFSFIKDKFPGLQLHASTQMTITGVEGALYLEQLGFSRVVTARELSADEILQIRQNTSIEIESFVHGALCYCYSGQCLFSSMLGGRSGNRGRCAQPCRLPYQVSRDGKLVGTQSAPYVLSPKDICTVEILPDLIEAGINSFKIEGRMKRPEYTAGVTSVYRKYLDYYLEHGRERYEVLKEDRDRLLDLYSRGGISQGYYFKQNGKEMLTLSSPGYQTGEDSVFEEIRRSYIEEPLKRGLDAFLVLEAGKPAYIKIKAGEAETEAFGEQVQEAERQPMTEERILKQMKKVGSTQFYFQNVEISICGSVFISVQGLNSLRRDGIARLEEILLQKYRRTLPKHKAETAEKPTREELKNVLPSDFSFTLHASVETEEQLEEVLKAEEIKAVYVDCLCLPGNTEDQVGKLREYADNIRKSGKKSYYILPAIFRESVKKKYEQYFFPERFGNADGVLVKNYEEYYWLKRLGYSGEIVLDHNVYQFNGCASAFWKKEGISFSVLPLELNDRELAELGCSDKELLVYGYLPLMVSAQCMEKTTEGCTRQKRVYYLQDRYKKKFPVKNNCSCCYNTIYNSVPLQLIQSRKKIEVLKPKYLRLQFTLENGKETKEILESYIQAFIRKEQCSYLPKEFTKGHFGRGIE